MLDSGEAGLTPIPQPAKNSAETETTETFQGGGQKAPTRLTVFTTLKNLDAEWMRAVLASTSREELASSYLNEYARRYPSTISAAQLIVDDHAGENILTITQQYTIPNFWVPSADKQRYNAQFYPLGIHYWIAKPATVSRSMPIELSYPRRRIVHTEIDLPTQFKLTSLTNTISGPAAELRIQRTVQPQKVLLDYDFSTLTNNVPVSLVPDHLKSLDEMENAINYSLYWQNLELVRARWFNWPIFLTALLFTATFIVALVILYRWQYRLAETPSGPPPVPVDSHLKGLGGWLIMVMLVLILGLYHNVANVLQTSKCFSWYTWQALTTPEGLRYNPAWEPILIFELLGNLAIIVMIVFNSVLFIQKRRGFPQWFIIMLAGSATIVIVDHIAVQSFLDIPFSRTESVKHTQQVFNVIVGCCVWIPYMCVSRRVKATFVD